MGGREQVVSIAATDLGKPSPRRHPPLRPPANPHTHLQSSVSLWGGAERGVKAEVGGSWMSSWWCSGQASTWG